ncbi:MAG: hypothetical protein AAGA93_26950 [Actinomycetota bacterium]
MKPRPISELRESGVLWAINRTLFHPRGFALALHLNDDGTVEGWSIQGDGAEVWSFSPDDDDESFEAFAATLSEVAK